MLQELGWSEDNKDMVTGGAGNHHAPCMVSGSILGLSGVSSPSSPGMSIDLHAVISAPQICHRFRNTCSSKRKFSSQGEQFEDRSHFSLLRRSYHSRRKKEK